MPQVVGDDKLIKPNTNLGRCTAPLWLREINMLRGKVATTYIVKDIQGLMKKGDSENHNKIVKIVEKVIRSDSDGHQKVEIAISMVSKALNEIVAQEYDIVKHDLGTKIDDIECEENQEGIISIKERLRKENERIINLEADKKYWRDF